MRGWLASKRGCWAHVSRYWQHSFTEQQAAT
jgi:hypothetical protein